MTTYMVNGEESGFTVVTKRKCKAVVSSSLSGYVARSQFSKGLSFGDGWTSSCKGYPIRFSKYRKECKDTKIKTRMVKSQDGGKERRTLRFKHRQTSLQKLIHTAKVVEGQERANRKRIEMEYTRTSQRLKAVLMELKRRFNHQKKRQEKRKRRRGRRERKGLVREDAVSVKCNSQCDCPGSNNDIGLGTPCGKYCHLHTNRLYLSVDQIRKGNDSTIINTNNLDNIFPIEEVLSSVNDGLSGCDKNQTSNVDSPSSELSKNVITDDASSILILNSGRNHKDSILCYARTWRGCSEYLLFTGLLLCLISCFTSEETRMEVGYLVSMAWLFSGEIGCGVLVWWLWVLFGLQEGGMYQPCKHETNGGMLRSEIKPIGLKHDLLSDDINVCDRVEDVAVASNITQIVGHCVLAGGTLALSAEWSTGNVCQGSFKDFVRLAPGACVDYVLKESIVHLLNKQQQGMVNRVSKCLQRKGRNGRFAARYKRSLVSFPTLMNTFGIWKTCYGLSMRLYEHDFSCFESDAGHSSLLHGRPGMCSMVKFNESAGISLGYRDLSLSSSSSTEGGTLPKWRSCALSNEDWERMKDSERLEYNPMYEDIIEPTDDDINGISGLPLLVIEVMDREYVEICCSQRVKYEGGLHYDRLKYIKKVLIIEADFCQVYVARMLHAFPHYQIMRNDLSIFVDYCKACNVDHMFVSRETVMKEYILPELSSDFLVRVVNLSNLSPSDQITVDEQIDASLNMTQIRHIVDGMCMNQLMELSMKESGRGISERGNYQSSIGVQMLNYERDDETCLPRPVVCSDARGTYQPFFVAASHVLELMGYKFPDDKPGSDYADMLARGAREIHSDNRIDALTGIASFYRWESNEVRDVASQQGDAEKTESSSERPVPPSGDLDASCFRWNEMDVLRCHTDQGNAKEEGRDFSLAITKVRRLWEWKWVPNENQWRYVQTGLVRVGSTNYCKHAISCTSNRDKWMEPILDQWMKYFTSLEHWQKDLFRIFEAKESALPFHSDIMSHISNYVSPFMQLDKKFCLTKEQAVEFGFILLVANAPQRMVEEVSVWLEESQLPLDHLAIAYINQTRLKYGSAAGGSNPRRQVSFTQPMAVARMYEATKHVMGLIDEVNARSKTRTGRLCYSRKQVRRLYIGLCKDIERTVPCAGELISQLMVKFYTAIGLIENPLLLTCAYIPSTTESGRRIIKDIQKQVEDVETARELFKAYKDSLLSTFAHRIMDHLNAISLTPQTVCNEAIAENVACKHGCDPGKVEVLEPGRIIMVVGEENDNGQKLPVRMTFTKNDPVPRMYKRCWTHSSVMTNERVLNSIANGNNHGMRIQWENLAFADLASLTGTVESHITRDEFVQFMDGSPDAVGRAKQIWQYMSKQRQDVLFGCLTIEQQQNVRSWPRTRPSRESAVSSLGAAAGHRTSNCVDPLEGESCAPGKQPYRSCHRRVPRATRSPQVAKEKMRDLMNGKCSCTSLSSDAMERALAKHNIWPSPWSAALVPKSDQCKGRSREATVQQQIHTRIQKLREVESKCLTAVTEGRNSYIPYPMRLELGHLVSGSESLQGHQRKCRRRVINYSDLSDEHIETQCGADDMNPGKESVDFLVSGGSSPASMEVRPGTYFFQTEGLLDLLQRYDGHQVSLRYYFSGKAGLKDENRPGYFATVIRGNMEVDYSWCTILRGLLSGEMQVSDPYGRMLYRTKHEAAVAATLNAVLDAPCVGMMDEASTQLRRLNGGGLLLSDLLSRKGVPFIWNKNQQGLDYLLLKEAGKTCSPINDKQSPGQRTKQCPVEHLTLFLIRKWNNEFLIGGYDRGHGSFVEGRNTQTGDQVSSFGNSIWRSLVHLENHGRLCGTNPQTVDCEYCYPDGSGVHGKKTYHIRGIKEGKVYNPVNGNQMTPQSRVSISTRYTRRIPFIKACPPEAKSEGSKKRKRRPRCNLCGMYNHYKRLCPCPAHLHKRIRKIGHPNKVETRR